MKKNTAQKERGPLDEYFEMLNSLQNLSRDALAAGDYLLAEEWAKECINFGAGQVNNGYIELGNCYMTTGKFYEAIKQFEECIRLTEDKQHTIDHCNCKIAACYVSLEDYESAQKMIDKIENKDDPYVIDLTATIKRARENKESTLGYILRELKKAREGQKNLSDDNPKKGSLLRVECSLLLHAGIIERESKDFEKSKHYLRECIRKSENKNFYDIIAKAKIETAKMAIANGQFGTARKYLKESIQHGHAKDIYYTLQCYISIQEKEYDSAKLHCDEAIKRNDRSPINYLYRAWIQLSKKEYNQAKDTMEEYDKLAQRKRPSCTVEVTKGNIHLFLGNIDTALQHYQKAVDIHDHDKENEFDIKIDNGDSKVAEYYLSMRQPRKK